MWSLVCDTYCSVCSLYTQHEKLQSACVCGDLYELQLLLRQGANPNWKTDGVSFFQFHWVGVYLSSRVSGSLHLLLYVYTTVCCECNRVDPSLFISSVYVRFTWRKFTEAAIVWYRCQWLYYNMFLIWIINYWNNFDNNWLYCFTHISISPSCAEWHDSFAHCSLWWQHQHSEVFVGGRACLGQYCTRCECLITV